MKLKLFLMCISFILNILAFVACFFNDQRWIVFVLMSVSWWIYNYLKNTGFTELTVIQILKGLKDESTRGKSTTLGGS